MTPKTYIFAIAIETYQDGSIKNVDYAENDARKFVDAWQQLGVDPADCVVLASAQATLAAVRSRLQKFLKNIRAGERVVFFYAGHGAAFNDISYITVHDTQRGDIQATSISLGEILEWIRKSQSDQAFLFIDSCHSGLPINDKMRSLYSKFSADELIAFCKDSEFHVAFASCDVDEYSFPSRKLKHGIWSYCLIEALEGRAKDALERGRILTGSSLQAYLRDEVPRVLKVTITGTETQTPCVFGNYTKEFVIADFEDLFRQRMAASSGPVNLIKDASLVGERGGAVKGLSGYRKPRMPLSTHSSWEKNFVEEAGTDEVAEIAEEIFKALGASFEYKRKDISFECDAGGASIKTPEFDVNVSLQQDPESADQYVLITEVATFRSPEIVEDPEFLKIFTQYCDTVVIDLAAPINIGSKIDEIEETGSFKNDLKYDAKNTYFDLRVRKVGVKVHVTTDQMRFTLDGGGDLRELIAKSHQAVTHLAGANITLQLPSNVKP